MRDYDNESRHNDRFIRVLFVSACVCVCDFFFYFLVLICYLFFWYFFCSYVSKDEKGGVGLSAFVGYDLCLKDT